MRVIFQVLYSTACLKITMSGYGLVWIVIINFRNELIIVKSIHGIRLPSLVFNQNASTLKLKK